MRSLDETSGAFFLTVSFTVVYLVYRYRCSVIQLPAGATISFRPVRNKIPNYSLFGQFQAHFRRTFPRSFSLRYLFSYFMDTNTKFANFHKIQTLYPNEKFFPRTIPK